MHTKTPTAEIDPPKPTDPPFLFAILIGAKKTGDKMMQSLAREWLAEIGIRVQFAKNAPALRMARTRAEQTTSVMEMAR